MSQKMRQVAMYNLGRITSIIEEPAYIKAGSMPVKMFTRDKNGRKGKEIAASLIEKHHRENDCNILLILKDKRKEIGRVQFEAGYIDGDVKKPAIYVGWLDCLNGLKKYKGASNILTQAVFEAGLQLNGLARIFYDLEKVGYGDKLVYSENLVKSLGGGQSHVTIKAMKKYLERLVKNGNYIFPRTKDCIKKQGLVDQL